MKRTNVDLARNLRKESTLQETKLWRLLRNRNIFSQKLRRQHQIRNYIVDFCCIEAKLIIELDGGQHNKYNIIQKDEMRTKFLKGQGYKILRFWNNEIDNNIEGVIEKIQEYLP